MVIVVVLVVVVVVVLVVVDYLFAKQVTVIRGTFVAGKPSRRKQSNNFSWKSAAAATAK